METAAAVGEHVKDEEEENNEVYADILCEFFEIAIHLILYIRGVYPAALFQRKSKYNIPVYVSGHPELNEYVRNVVEGIRPLLRAGQADTIGVLIKNKDHIPVENFVFQTSKGFSRRLSCEDGCLVGLERELRALLLKISVSDALLQSNPPDCTFTVQVSTSESAAASIEHDQAVKGFPWICEDDGDVVGGGDGWSTIPLKSMHNDLVQVGLHVLQCISHKQH